MSRSTIKSCYRVLRLTNSPGSDQPRESEMPLTQAMSHGRRIIFENLARRFLIQIFQGYFHIQLDFQWKALVTACKPKNHRSDKMQQWKWARAHFREGARTDLQGAGQIIKCSHRTGQVTIDSIITCNVRGTNTKTGQTATTLLSPTTE